MKRIMIILTALCAAAALSACSSGGTAASPSDTAASATSADSSKQTGGEPEGFYSSGTTDAVSYDDDGETAFAALDSAGANEVSKTITTYDPKDGYAYQQAVIPLDSDDKLETYSLISQSNGETVGYVAFTLGGDSHIEIDVHTESATEDDLKAAFSMVANIISDTFSGLDVVGISGKIPLTYGSAKPIIDAGEHSDSIIYSDDFKRSISYEFFPDDGLFTFFVEYM